MLQNAKDGGRIGRFECIIIIQEERDVLSTYQELDAEGTKRKGLLISKFRGKWKAMRLRYGDILNKLLMSLVSDDLIESESHSGYQIPVRSMKS